MKAISNANVYKCVRSIAGDAVKSHKSIQDALYYANSNDAVTEIKFHRHGKKFSYLRTGEASWKESSL